ncbi:UNVERIFIED_CONTAM: NAP1-related protein 2 [Sesamum calycinum]|uniref:NAP1-related protein 2 n=1 Tax=Sesamum calycinum TaxID=2727403 RepID=A0AAW2NHG9_9LAMI
MGADKGKKQKSGEVKEENNGAEPIDGELVLSIEKLQEIQDELEKMNEEASEKVLEVEQKFNEIRKPVYNKRNDVIKSIPDFWLTAFMSHPALSELLTEEDQKIFKYLSDLEVEDFEDVKSGYSITFKFNPNPYFEDTNLTKTFTFLEEGITKITATSIKWKEGMGIANGVAEEKKGNKRSHAEERCCVTMLLPSIQGQMNVIFNLTSSVHILLCSIIDDLASKVCPDLPNAHEFPAFNNYAMLGALENSFFTWFNDSEHKGDMYEIHDEEADEEDLEVDDDDDDEEKGSDGSEDDDDEQDEEDEDED